MYKVYLITNIENKKQYVGITKFSIGQRFLQHTKRGFILTDAIKKYGNEKFTVKLIEESETAEKAYNLEKYYVKKFNTKIPNGYNMTDGGDGLYGVIIGDKDRKRRSKVMKKLHKEKRTGMHGKKHSEETRKKMSISGKNIPKPWLYGRVLSENSKQKIREKNLGRIHSEETRKKISENHHDISGKNNPMYGRKHSDETKEKIRKKAKNRPKRIWINNGISEKLIPIDKPIPEGYDKGRKK